MFDKKNLHKVGGCGVFNIWFYDGGRMGEQARTIPGFFPLDAGPKAGDAVYIDGLVAGTRRTTHHYFEQNSDQLTVWLFG